MIQICCGQVNGSSLKILIRLFICLLLLTAVLFIPPADAQEKTPLNSLRISPEQMAASLEKALTSQRAELADLKARVQQIEKFKNALLIEIETYESQNTIHRQLLLSAQLRIEDLEYAVRNNQLASRTLSERIDKFKKQWEDTPLLFQSAGDRIALAEKQMTEIRQYQLSAEEIQSLEESTDMLLLVLRQKKKFGEMFQKVYDDLLDRMKTALKSKKAIGEELAARLESRRKASLFTQSTPFRDLMGKNFSKDLSFFQKRITSVFSDEAWQEQWRQIKIGRIEYWVFFLLMLAVIAVFQGRGRNALRKIEEKRDGQNWYYRRLGLLLLRNSLPSLSMLALFGIYTHFRFSLLNIGMGRRMLQIFTLMLVSRWGIDYLNHADGISKGDIYDFVSFHLKRFFRFYRGAGTCMILLIWIAGRDSLLIWMGLTVLLTAVLVWAIIFWQRLKKILIEGVRKGRPRSKWETALIWWGYSVIDIALVLNLIGYDTLSLLWFTSWCETIALLFWAWLTLNIIREWQKDHETEAAQTAEEARLNSSYHWRWTQIKLVRAVWIFAMAELLLHTWDPLGFISSKLAYFAGLPLTVGTLHFSIKGIVLAVIILFFTHLGVRLGRSVLTEKILDKHAFETGLKDSILTITSYLCWGVALLLALSILGVNATSLAVVFGALSVGIGFGLQNIVNNFISGLILLFERPIQVGDTVEVGGLWATVKQINVRATVVQTFDNAMLIIPNSEFISKQVINWSKADRRMRRNIEVGVAYGSDIELVQKILLETALNENRVLRYPRPDVIFIDHGPSALLFRLRVWVHEDNYWAVPSQIRCEIDRRFRELDIEIAFPQQDVHIRTVPEKSLSGFSDDRGISEAGRQEDVQKSGDDLNGMIQEKSEEDERG